MHGFRFWSAICRVAAVAFMLVAVAGSGPGTAATGAEPPDDRTPPRNADPGAGGANIPTQAIAPANPVTGAAGTNAPERATSPESAAQAPATYAVRLLAVSPPRLAVTADLPIDGQSLEMDTTRPAGIPELDARGWPALVSNLRVSDAAGRRIEATSAGEPGWQLTRPHSGRLTVEYEVDYSSLAARGWPAPREAAWADESHVVLVGRSVFITTPEAGSSTVSFALPRGWRPVTPWQPTPGSARELAAGAAADLVENLLVLTRSRPDVVTAGGYRLLVASMGHWKPARREVRRVLEAVAPRLAGLTRVSGQRNYLVVLLPVVERGGESYRHSFALTQQDPPSRANSAGWGNLIAHEILHEWNGWGLQGADYATSQWFQEGFTEYAANISMVAAGLVSPDGFMRKIADHVGKYKKLTTSLEAGGSRKGPPLYSGGALVALAWDVQIRGATHGERNLWDFMGVLWRRTDDGHRPYEWRDIQAALEATAPLDWGAFHRAHIQGSEPLPLGEVLALAGVRLDEGPDGAPRVAIDPAASASSKALWRALLEGGQD